MAGGKKKIHELPYIDKVNKNILIPASRGTGENDTVSTSIGVITDQIAASINTIPVYSNPNYPFTEQLGFINSLRKTIPIVPESGHDILLNNERDFDYIGIIDGQFFIPNNIYNTKSPDITPFLPSGVSDYPSLNSWTGEITGQIASGFDTVNPLSTTYKVVVFKLTSNGEEFIDNVSVQNNGFWTFNGTLVNGIFVFKIYRISTDLEVGINWVNNNTNQSVYENLRIDYYSVTGSETKIGESHAKLGKIFYFYYNVPGYKKAKLVRVSDSKVLSETSFMVDLPRSFVYSTNDTESSNGENKRAYLQDVAYSLIAAIKTQEFELANKIVRGILTTQYPDGAFPLYVAHDNSGYAQNLKLARSSTIAWVCYSLCFYIDETPTSPLKTYVNQSLVNGLSYLSSLMNGSGTTENAVRTGNDLGNPINTFEAIGTMLSYFAFYRASLSIGNDSYKVTAESIKDALIANFYQISTNKFHYALNENGSPVSSDTLELNYIGIMFLMSNKRKDFALNLIKRIEDFYRISDTILNVDGFKPYNGSFGFAEQNRIWFEGTSSVSHAYNTLGFFSDSVAVLDKVFKFQQTDGSYRQGVKRDLYLTITDKKSLSSTCWFIFAASNTKDVLVHVQNEQQGGTSNNQLYFINGGDASGANFHPSQQ